MSRLTHMAHQMIEECLLGASIEDAATPLMALDGTAGNGHDTVFLARLVAPSGGRVWSFDCQAAAIESTMSRLRLEGLESVVELCHASHCRLGEVVPSEVERPFAAFMFNLGYLPGSDKSLVTQKKTTIPALREAVGRLRVGGIGLVTIYRGHEGGMAEAKAVEEWRASLGNEFRQEVFESSSKETAPYLLSLKHLP